MARGKKRVAESEPIEEDPVIDPPGRPADSVAPAAAVDSSAAPLVEPPRRRSERRRKIDEGIVDPPKEKRMTIGAYLLKERTEQTEELSSSDTISKYETFTNYEKDEVVTDLGLEEVSGFCQQLYHSEKHHLKVLFIPLRTGPHPKDFSHICNNSSLQWYLRDMRVTDNNGFLALGNVFLVFIQGDHIEGLTRSAANYYKCLGLIGVQSVSSGRRDYTDPQSRYECIRATLVFDYVISRKEMEQQFGGNVMKCKKNKYGCSICA
jgi:hypothetical protein